MVSKAQRGLNLLARYFQKPTLALARPPWVARQILNMNARLMYKTPGGLRQRFEVLKAEGAQVPATWVDCGGKTGDGVLLFLHGGAFVIGSLRAYRHLVARLADATGMAGCFVDYRLAPEHPFPAAPEDALTAYRALLASGVEPGRIAVVGDSAGGCLAFSLLHQIGLLGLPMPGAVAAMSPVVDLSGGSASLSENQRRDLVLPVSFARRGVADYLQGADPMDPVASPLFGQFAGAPPVMMQVCESEILRDESYRMAEVLRAQGVQVRLDEWHDVPHVWHLNAGRSPEADKGIADIADFLRETLNL